MGHGEKIDVKQIHNEIPFDSEHCTNVILRKQVFFLHVEHRFYCTMVYHILSVWDSRCQRTWISKLQAI